MPKAKYSTQCNLSACRWRDCSLSFFPIFDLIFLKLKNLPKHEFTFFPVWQGIVKAKQRRNEQQASKRVKKKTFKGTVDMYMA
jgi:hypothetical protein